MNRIITALALVLAALTLAPSALADRDEHRDRDETETFVGTCQFAGTLRQDPPLTIADRPGEASATARGTCTGTLTDADGDIRQLDAERASYFASARGTMSCGGGSAAGSGYLQIRGERLRFRFSETRGPGFGVIRLEGADGGSAAGEARASEDEDPGEIALKCMGEGLRRVGIRIDIATTPALSG
jgi:hypothetical protein